MQDPAVQTAAIPRGRAWETSERSELLLICPIRCLSLNNVPAISLLSSACCRENGLKMGFDFQLCETWLQTGTWVPPELVLLLGNWAGSSLQQLLHKHKDAISSPYSVCN